MPPSSSVRTKSKPRKSTNSSDSKSSSTVTVYYASQSKIIIFHDFIDNKVIYSENYDGFSIYIYDFETTIGCHLPEDTLYLGTTSSNKIVFKNKKRLAVLILILIYLY